MEKYEIVFTEHFWKQFNIRKSEAPLDITLDTVMDAIQNPDFIFQDKIANRENRIKKINGRCLKVVVEKKDNILIVMTVFFDRGLKRRGLCS
ncbi:DUF4258 domain-containing protein [Sulfurihydrogenibium subterraneum]|uniref:DUF4258 domain-containing protein n=1 Tax=Sulfurihydrogenibium subterraneum TaxID=171121 RepID=UPI00048F8E32|nr:DUF4258 domain-containing protein [Sulfurihydrogenibium subterraneum]